MSESIKKLSPLGLVAVMLVYVASQSALIINPALANLEAEYQAINPAITHVDILLLSTVVQMTMMIAGFIGGSIVGRKVGYKKITVVSCAMILISGIFPYFIPGQYMPILLCRAVLGIGSGIVQPLGNVLVMKFYEGENRSKMLGLGTAVMNVGAVIVQLVAGVVCAVNTNATFLVHAFVALPMIMILLFMPEPGIERTESASADGSTVKSSIPPAVFLMSFAYGLMFMFFYPLLLNCSSILIGEGLGTAATAGTVGSVYTAGGIIAGLIFGSFNKRAGKYTIPICLVVYIIGIACGAFAKNAVMYMLASLLSGIAIFSIWPAAMMEFGKIVPPDRFGFASGLWTALLNLGAFVSAYYVGFVAKISGSDSPRLPIIIGLICAAVIAVIWGATICAKKQRKEKKEEDYVLCS